MTDIIAGQQQYQIEAMIGEGAMGTVYRARVTGSAGVVAIKQLKMARATPQLIERFQREGAALRALNHPNIVALRDTVTTEEQHYLVMDYVQGGDLAQLLEQGALPVETILSMGIDLADALTRAHKLGIVHRDLKPANVLIADDGTLRLTDFGVARVAENQTLTEAESIVGTVDYIAPEVFQGQQASEQSDIWAFGVLLFEMLTGKRPFKGGSVSETILNITQKPLPDSLSDRDDVPLDLMDLVYRMLEKDPAARMTSVRYAGAILEDIREGRATTTAIEPPASRFATDTTAQTVQAVANLPAQVTPFIGREIELQAVQTLLDDKTRLVTIVGPGGMGKTRLALEAAQRNLALFTDGAVFVDLAPVQTLNTVEQAIADALDYQIKPGAVSPRQQILDWLAPKQMLLILDNYEHLLEAAPLVTEILQAAPEVCLLVTSRRRLQQSGETLFHLSGMDFPDWETPEDALDYAAFRLFMSRATRARPGFDVDATSLDAIARICRLVEGMPLGIVLAAGWLAMLSPQEIAQEIQQSMDFLEGEAGVVPERQRSIRAVCDYAWKTLSEANQAVFMTLSVFRGGFSREAAQAVSGASLRQMMTLVSQSLLRRNADTGRYSIHELLRQYAAEKLESAGQLESARDTHATYYADLLHSLEETMRGHGQLKAFKTVEADLDNIMQAWEWSLAQQRDDLLNRLIDSLTNYMQMKRYPFGRDFLERARQQRGTDALPVLRAKLLLELTQSSYPTDALEPCIADIDEAIAIFEKEDAPAWQSCALFVKGMAYVTRGHNQEATQAMQRALTFAESINDTWVASGSRAALGFIANVHRADQEASLHYYEKAYEGFSQIGNQLGLGLAAHNLGHLMYQQDRIDRARYYLNESCQNALMFGHYERYLMSMFVLSNIEYAQGNAELALEILRQAEQVLKRTTDTIHYLGVQHHIFRMRLLTGDYDGLLEDARALLEKLPTTSDAMLFRNVTKATIGLMLCISQQEYEQAQPLLEDSFMSIVPFAQPGMLVPQLLGLSLVKAHQGDAATAVTILGCLSQDVADLIMPETVIYQTVLSDVRDHINDDNVFDRHWQAGRDLTFKELVQRIKTDIEARQNTSA